MQEDHVEGDARPDGDVPSARKHRFCAGFARICRVQDVICPYLEATL